MLTTPRGGGRSTGNLGLEGSTVSIGAIQHILAETYDGRAQCIGYVDGHTISLCPKPAKKIKWDKGYRVIAVIRRI